MNILSFRRPEVAHMSLVAKCFVSLFVAILSVDIGAGRATAQRSERMDSSWTERFDVERTELASRGRNPYFILEPGYTLVLEDRRERLIVTVLDDTRRVDEVETRVVEERETNNGELVEVSRNYFAISSRTNSVFYFGEEVDIYKAGKIVSHEGAWLSGRDGARFGLMMPGIPLMRARYYQEIAPRVAMDRAEIVGVNESIATPAGTFQELLKVEETTPLEPGVKEYKYFARGVGLVQDGSLKLVKYGDHTSPSGSPLRAR